MTQSWEVDVILNGQRDTVIVRAGSAREAALIVRERADRSDKVQIIEVNPR